MRSVPLAEKCIASLMPPSPPASIAPPAEPCRVLLATDRLQAQHAAAGLFAQRSWQLVTSAASGAPVDAAAGGSFSREHGPWAGMAAAEDLELMSHATGPTPNSIPSHRSVTLASS